MRSLNGQDRPREQKPQRANVLTSGQRFSVRVALATGATLAALMGVQTLALQEQNLYAADTTSLVIDATPTADEQAAVIVTNDSSTVVQAAAPNIIVQATAQPTTVIQATAVPVIQATAQPTTAVTVNTTTSSQPRPSTRSSR